MTHLDSFYAKSLTYHVMIARNSSRIPFKLTCPPFSWSELRILNKTPSLQYPYERIYRLFLQICRQSVKIALLKRCLFSLIFRK